ncbi:unnamed protein product [Rotaria sp. Silwood1]|nr:unnamed protein product [Rotaria sp. Silwood1]
MEDKFLNNRINVIPRPLVIQELPGIFTLSNDTIIIAAAGCENELRLFKNNLKEDFNFEFSDKTDSKSVIKLILNDNQVKDESYHLHVDVNKIEIIGWSTAGIFYGLQTLRQLINNEEKLTIPCVHIEDRPRFQWRSFMLDVARYFKNTSTIKQLLNEISQLKMNRFHWHLTDDQGWRIEIKKYPKLTEIGSIRSYSQTGGWNSVTFDNTIHEGYYTQEEIKEIIQYANERHIQIVPEIDMPGHASAAIASYPSLGCDPQQPINVPGEFCIHHSVFNVANSQTTEFLENVLDEVIDLFSTSDVIHIGGDEVKYGQWELSTEITKFINEHNLQSPADLQIWFTNKISNFINGKHRRMMGWNEIMGDIKLHHYTTESDILTKEKLAQNTIVQFWTGSLDLLNKIISHGYDVINSYCEYTYLDYSHYRISLEKAYNFDPIPERLPEEFYSKILGLGCQMWGEWIPTIDRMNQQIFPRLAAYAEVGWTSLKNKNYQNFQQKLTSYFYKRWDKQEISYYKLTQ